MKCIACESLLFSEELLTHGAFEDHLNNAEDTKEKSQDTFRTYPGFELHRRIDSVK